jgi:leucyl-tRNA synthetase
MRFNTAISKLMEFVNAFTADEVRPLSSMWTFALLLAPMAPHLAEELWQILGGTASLAYEPWPTYDAKLLIDEQVEIPVQINGKLRGRITVPSDIGAEELEVAAMSDEKIVPFLQGKTIKKAIVLPGKLVNFVVA